MNVLATGGTGVLGTGVVTELVRRGHHVVHLGRHADHDAQAWPSGVTGWRGDVANAKSIEGAAEGCDVVLHMAGIAVEHGDATFEAVNVRGTANVLAEAERAGVPRFIFVSSLGAPIGRSDYHKSKVAGEALTRRFPGAWTIVRPGNIYGPGDGQISLLLRLVRGPSPIVPRVGDGEQPLQPLWWEDCAKALATIVERPDLAGRELDIAGLEVTSQNDLIRRMSEITGRGARGISVPDHLVTLGAKVISLVGWPMSFTRDQATMLAEGNVVPENGINALQAILGVTPTPLDEGLRRLAALQPEQFPTGGIGTLKRKRYWADIAGGRHDAESLFTLFKRHFSDVLPIFVNAREDQSVEITEGDTVTLSLPMRGHIQVRAVEVDSRHATVITLEGHPLAGAVRFLAEERGRNVRFQVEVFDRAATVVDLVTMRTFGDLLQNRTWRHVVERMIEHSGGRAEDGVHQETESLDDDKAQAVERWLDAVALRHVRHENAEKIASRD